MPLPPGHPTLDDAVVVLQGGIDPRDTARYRDVFAGAAVDLNERLKNLEHAHLEDMHRIGDLETALATSNDRLASVTADRDTNKKRIDAIEQAPNANAKRMDDLEKRVRTVEGAVGAANLKKPPPFVEPVKPFTPPNAAAPSAAPQTPIKPLPAN